MRITPFYWGASGLVVFLFGLVTYASISGLGVTSDAQAMAQARARGASVRGGSLHRRHYFGGGPGFGK